MSDHPPENPGSTLPPFAGAAPEAPSRSLSEILEELALITTAHQGDASAMRGAVSELTRALARLFEMIRADRADQRARIAELEAALQAANARVAELEAGEVAAPGEGPAASDFDALRDAAERLRKRTEELVREAGTPAEQAAREEAHAAEETGEAVEVASAGALSNSTELPSQAIHDEPFGAPGVLRVFPGAVLRKDLTEDLDIESELVFDEDVPQRMSAVAPAPTPAPGTALGDVDAPEPPRPQLTVRPRPEPIAVHPRPARKRRALRRRRIDARKLSGVDPAAALRAMVSSVDDLWTAGNGLDLVVALTDGGTLHVTGGDRVPLRVDEVEAGTSARSTVTATSDQIVPLFGRLELSAEQSTPLIHGSRRDADLLVGWIDRAQRLSAEPL